MLDAFKLPEISITSYDGHNFGGPANADLFARCAEAAKTKLLKMERNHAVDPT